MTDAVEMIRLLRSAARLDPDRAIRPQVGDVVIDRSRWTPDPTMIGVLEKIEDDPVLGRLYIVKPVAGEAQVWINAEPLTIRAASPPPPAALGPPVP